jgi:hypothetical protein
MKTASKQEAQLKVLAFLYDGCDSLYLFSIVKSVRVKSLKFTCVVPMAPWSLIHIEPPTVTLRRRCGE